jgi:hypothetical protein
MDPCQRLILCNPESGHQSETGTFKTQSAAKIEMSIVLSPRFTGLFVVAKYETMGLPGRGSRLVTGVAAMMDYKCEMQKEGLSCV